MMCLGDFFNSSARSFAKVVLPEASGPSIDTRKGRSVFMPVIISASFWRSWERVIVL